jgi:hypothetical protein
VDARSSSNLAYESADFAVPPDAADSSATPFYANGDGGGWRCICGAGPHASLPDRCAAGHPAPGNEIAVQHGAYRRTPLPDVRADVEAMVAGIVSDLGGESALSTLQRRTAAKLAGLEAQWQMFEHDIAVNGILTPSGGVRRVHEAMLRTFYAWDRAAQRIGLDRRARAVNFHDRLVSALDAKRAREDDGR